MARMHSRRRGQSSSRKPYRTQKPDWIEADKQKITSLIVERYNKGISTSRIGIELRDMHGVPDLKTAFGTSMYEVLKENGVKMDYPEDIVNLMRKAVRLHRHLSTRKKDLHNVRSLQLVEAKIRRLGRYYSRRGVLPLDWAYSYDKAKLIVAD